MLHHLALLAACFVTVVAPLPPAPDYGPFGLRLIYEDDFWQPLNEAVFNRLDGYVQTSWDLVCYSRDDSYTESGNLVLRTRLNDRVCNGKLYHYTSGWVDTLDKLSVRNGRLEVSAKLPPPAFRNWPAAWMISETNRRDTGQCWPLASEIDLYEAVSMAHKEPSRWAAGVAFC